MPKRRKQIVDQKISDLFSVKRRNIANNNSCSSGSSSAVASSSSTTATNTATATTSSSTVPAARVNTASTSSSLKNENSNNGNNSATIRQLSKPEEGASSTASSSSVGNLSQHDLTVLRDFDLNWEFGPCIGITRLQRWERAVKRGLTPPQFVRSLVLAHANNPLYTECIWFSYSDLI